MKTLSRRENLIYSTGGLILLALIFSGFKGMLAAAAIVGWLFLVSGTERRMEQEDVSLFEAEPEAEPDMTEEKSSVCSDNVYYVSAEEWRRGRRKAS